MVVNKRTHIASENDVYIGRPSRWGNPFSHLGDTLAQYRVPSREQAVESYRSYLWAQLLADRLIEGQPLLHEVAGLHGKTLVCWCKPRSCHGDVLEAAAAWAVEQINPRET